MSDLEGKSYWDIKTTRNCGEKTLAELASIIEQLQSLDSSAQIISQTATEKQVLQNLALTLLTEKIYIPEQMRGLSLKQLPLSVRLANTLKSMNFRLLGDLQGIEFNEFNELRNCGNKTIKELKQLIEKAQNGELSELDSAKEIFDILPHEASFADLLNFIENFLIMLPNKERDILLFRFGGIDNKALTLEEVGSKYNLTRERIRQIQSRTLKILKDRIGDDILQKITHDCLTSVYPFTPQLLLHWTGEAVKIQYPPAFYVRLLAEISPEIPALAGENCKASQISPRWREIRRATKDFLQLNAGQNFSLIEIFKQIKKSAYFVNLSEKEFIEAVQSDSALDLNFDKPNEPIIKPNKTKTTAWVLQVLSRAENPLLPEEIIQRGKEIFGESIGISPFSLANILDYTDGFYLLDRRRFGLRKHFRLPEDRWNQLRNDFYNLLQQHKRPFSTTEVVGNEMFDWATQTNSTEAAQILREDERFADLHRFHFALAEWEIEERGYLRDLLIEILDRTGHPLTGMEILEQMQKVRSVAPTSLPTILSQNENVRNVGAGFYGLKKWGNKIQNYLVSSRKFVNRAISRCKPPLTFGDLCRKLEIAETGMLADKLWRTLQSLPKVRLKPNKQSPDTYLAHEKWRFEKAIQAVLEQAVRPLSIYEIQWELERIFGKTFDEKGLDAIKNCLLNNSLFVRNPAGEFLLNSQIEQHEFDGDLIRQECSEILSEGKGVLSADDLLEKLEAEDFEMKNISSEMLAALLRGDENFEEIGTNLFRSKK